MLKEACFASVVLFWAMPSQAHDWYSMLTTRQGDSCCNGRDCLPVDHRYTAAGLHVRLGDDRYPVGRDAVLPIASPDESAHACFMLQADEYSGGPATLVVRCVVLPGSS